MSKNAKISFKVYSAWNYQKEIEDLNEASRQGWQLVKGGCFHSKFVKNPEIWYDETVPVLPRDIQMTALLPAGSGMRPPTQPARSDYP